MRPNRIVSVAVTICLWVSLVTAHAVERQALHGHIPAAVKRLSSTGRLSGSTNLNLAIGLPLRNPETLTKLLQQIYDPASPGYRHYLTPHQFADRFGPTEQDYQTLIAFAKTNGLTVTGTHPNRMLLDVKGTVMDMERTFHVTMRTYRHPTEDRTFFAPDVEPSVDLALPILHVSGMENYALPHPRYKERQLGKTANATPSSGSGPSGSYRGNDFRSAYAPGTSLTGAGQNVGLLQFDGYYASDISNYISQASIQTSVTLTNVAIDGGVSTPGSGVTEVSLDIEMVISMAPGLSKVIVYEAPNPSPWVDLLNRMATDNLAKQLSCSWGGGSADVTADQIFQQMAAQGQSFFCASGDSDAFTGAIDFPEDNPNITLVGGTTLTMTSTGIAWSAETVWNWGLNGSKYVGSSGGISTYYSIPPWQQGISMITNKGSTTMRNIPDVALTADKVYVVYGNGSSSTTIGGTSCAAPLWAGFTALINEQAAAKQFPPVGFLNPAIYTIGRGTNYTAFFHDTATGGNTWPSSPTEFYATTGYDLCTGWGTPNGTNLINALAASVDALIITPVTGFSANGPVGGPFSTMAGTFSLTNALESTLTWSLSSTSAWLTASATSGTLTYGGPAHTVTISLAEPAASLSSGTYQGALVFSNQIDGVVQERSMTLSIGQSLVLNGGFEAGNFDEWDQSGKTVFTYVTNGYLYAHSGVYGVEMGPAYTLGYLSQPLATRSGQTYQVSCWLDCQAGNTPNEFLVTWSGSTLFDQKDIGAIGWTNLQFVVTATNSNTLLQFGFRDDPAYLGLDDISVMPMSVNPPSISLQPTNQMVWEGGVAEFSSFAWGTPPLMYQWQLNTTNVTNATNATMSLSGITANQAGAYHVVVSNLYGSAISSNAVLTVIVPLAVAFTASPSNGAAPLFVTFTDTSSGTITNRYWSFGDGGASNTPGAMVSHTYTNAGTYTVQLTISGPLGVATNTQSNSIIVTNLPPILTVTPTELDYGVVVLVKSGSQDFSVINGGSLTLTGTATVAGPFTISGSANYSVAAGQTGTVAVDFVPVTEGYFTNYVVFSSNGGTSSNQVRGVGVKATQSLLTFAPASPQTYDTTNALSVSGGSGTGLISYAVLGGPGQIVDGASLWVTSGSGAVTVQVTKAADALYNAAVATAQVACARAGQSIIFPPLKDQRTTNTLVLAATASSGLPVSFGIVSGPAQLTGGSNLSFTGTGLVSIVASQAGDSNWNSASAVTNTFNVTKEAPGTMWQIASFQESARMGELCNKGICICVAEGTDDRSGRAEKGELNETLSLPVDGTMFSRDTPGRGGDRSAGKVPADPDFRPC